MEDYYEYLDSNGVTTLYKLIKDDTVALIDSYSVTINGITTTLDTHMNDSDIHTPIADIESMVDTKISGLVNSAPETLDTLKELSDALGNDPNFATTIANQIGNKANSVHTHVVEDITDFPTIPTKVSELSNDSNFVTSTELQDYATKSDLNSKQDTLSEEQLSNIDSIPDKANKSDLSTVATSGSYKDLLDKPVIPEGADLSDYYNKGETDNLLNSKANTSDLAVVAKSGNYSDLINTPTIPTKLSQLENDMGFGTGSGGVITSISWTNITDKPNFSTVATSGSYTDLINKPTIPTVNNATLTIQKNSSNVATFTSNASSNVTANITVPTKVSELTNDSGYITGVAWGSVTGKPSFATVSTSGSYNDLSNKPTIPTKTSDLTNDSGFAIDSNVVHKSGNETINGIKTFISGLWVTNNRTTMGYSIKNSDLARNDVPTEHQHYTFRAYDKNDKILGEYCVEKSTTGASLLHMNVRSEDSNGKQLSESLYLNMSNDGSAVRFYPSSNNKMDLGMSGHKWAKIYSDDVVHTSGNETIAGNKTFTDKIISNKELHYTDTKYDWSDTSLNTWCDAGNVVWFDKNGTRRMHELVGANGGVWRKVCYINESRYFTIDSNKNISYEGISFKFNGKNIAIDENLVHTSGNETIAGSKTFSNQMYLGGGGTSYGQISAKDTNSILRLYGGTAPGNGANLDLCGEGLSDGGFSLRARTSDKLVALDGKIDGTLKWNGKNVAIDENLVHKSGNETINGMKTFNNSLTFCGNVQKKNDNVDRSVKPTSDISSNFIFLDKNSSVLGYLNHTHKTDGVNHIGLYVKDSNNGDHGFRITANNAVLPLSNGTYNLGTSSYKWANVYATTFNGNLKGNADTATSATKASYLDNYSVPSMNKIYLDWDVQLKGYVGLKVDNTTMGGLITTKNIGSQAANSATYATTQATSDNSTKIATTAWVRTYVNSVAGSNTVGSSVSAYWSNSSSVTAEGNSSSSGGYYPADYSDYITKTPTVGTIYSGAQLYTVLNASASATGFRSGSSGTIFNTTTTVQATFSSPISTTGKYLCTTANTVKLRGYTTAGSSSSVGTSSVVDNTSTKSIFIRVE